MSPEKKGTPKMSQPANNQQSVNKSPSNLNKKRLETSEARIRRTIEEKLAKYLHRDKLSSSSLSSAILTQKTTQKTTPQNLAKQETHESQKLPKFEVERAEEKM